MFGGWSRSLFRQGARVEPKHKKLFVGVQKKLFSRARTRKKLFAGAGAISKILMELRYYDFGFLFSTFSGANFWLYDCGFCSSVSSCEARSITTCPRVGTTWDKIVNFNTHAHTYRAKKDSKPFY